MTCEHCRKALYPGQPKRMLIVAEPAKPGYFPVGKPIVVCRDCYQKHKAAN